MSSEEPPRQGKLVVEACGNAPYSILSCPSGICSSYPDKWRYNHRFKWAVTLFCGVCVPEVSWTVCRFCSNQRTHMTTDSQINRHRTRYHSNSKKNSNPSVAEVPSPSLPHNEDLNNSDNEDLSAPSEEVTTGSSSSSNVPLCLNFSRMESNAYFKHVMAGGNGRALLAAKAVFNDEHVSSEMDPVDIELCYQLAKLCFSISRGTRETLAELLKLIVQKQKKIPVDITRFRKERWEMDIPQTVPALRNQFMEGSFSYIENLPHPPIRMIGEFAYVSVIDCIADLLGHGFPTDIIAAPVKDNVVTRLGESQVALQVLENAKRTHAVLPNLILWMLEWSDAFEPNNSTKKNRGSVQLKTVTIALPHKGKRTRQYTYCICVGPGKADTTAVERQFKQELESLKSEQVHTFYHGKLKKNVSVYAELIVSVQDQPERRKTNYMMLGSTRYSCRWGYILDYKYVYPIISSCPTCLSQLLSKGDCNEDCSDCFSWTVEKGNKQILFPPPENYPMDDCSLITEGRTKLLSARLVTYGALRNAINVAHSKFIEQKWTTVQVRAYLTANGINTEAINFIIEHAINVSNLEMMDKENNPDGYETILQYCNDNPRLFKQWPTPSFWDRGIELQQHIDAVMHLLFLGVVKTIMLDSQEWLKSKKKFESFLVVVKNVMVGVTDLGLTWCRAVPYGSGKFGAHVSENYLASGRLSKWVFNLFSKVVATKEFSEPTTPQNKWIKPINLEWLRIRGLCTDGDAGTVRERVCLYMNSNDGPPPILPERGGSIECVESLYCALVAMLSRVMADTTTPELIKSVDRHVRLFLDYYEAFDKNLRKSDSYPSWTSHYNFLSLLNLPDQMSRYGPVRNMYEGGTKGEAFITYIKPELVAGLRKFWAFNVLRKVMRRSALSCIKLDDVNNEDPDEHTVSGMFKLYKGSVEVRGKIHDHLPLSCTIHENGSLFCQTVDKGQVLLQRLGFAKEEFGLCYHKWKVADLYESNLTDVIDYGILLPCLCSKGIPERQSQPLYCLITSRWLEMMEDGTISLPRVPCAYYDDSLI